MLVTIQFDSGDKFAAAFPDDVSTDAVVAAVRTTLDQQLELESKVTALSEEE